MSHKLNELNKLYKYKYEKYKRKNTKFVGGGNMTTSSNTDNYILANSETSDGFICPEDKPYLCTYKTDNFGLCKTNQDDCVNDDPDEASVASNLSKDVGGQSYGYVIDHLHKKCSLVKKVYEFINQSEYEAPSNLKIMTYNIWGLEKYNSDESLDFLQETMKIRLEKLAEIVQTENPDIVCFQEMSVMAYNILRPLISSYRYAYEENFGETFTKDQRTQRNRNLEVFILSKYPPSYVTLYSNGGNLGYDNSFMVIGFKNLILANCYCQAGSKFSPGQEKIAIHYSRCRYQQYKSLCKKLIELQNGRNIPFVITGDFNTNLNGNIVEWRELKAFSDHTLKDVWKELNDITINDGNTPEGLTSGNTEDTTINTMRWNTKFMPKHFRYDGFLYRGNIVPTNIKIVGRDPIILSETMSEKMKKIWIPNDSDREDKIIYSDTNKNLLELFPSDHFGVVATFML